jgi:hypothetical protein
LPFQSHSQGDADIAAPDPFQRGQYQEAPTLLGQDEPLVLDRMNRMILGSGFPTPEARHKCRLSGALQGLVGTELTIEHRFKSQSPTLFLTEDRLGGIQPLFEAQSRFLLAQTQKAAAIGELQEQHLHVAVHIEHIGILGKHKRPFKQQTGKDPTDLRECLEGLTRKCSAGTKPLDDGE